MKLMVDETLDDAARKLPASPPPASSLLRGSAGPTATGAADRHHRDGGLIWTDCRHDREARLSVRDRGHVGR